MQEKWTPLVSKKQKTLFEWLDFIISTGLPFSMVENPKMRNVSKLDSISIKSLMKYMDVMTKSVEKEIRKILPKQFAVIFDGWSMDGTSIHYIAAFASFLHNGIPQKGRI